MVLFFNSDIMVSSLETSVAFFYFSFCLSSTAVNVGTPQAMVDERGTRVLMMGERGTHVLMMVSVAHACSCWVIEYLDLLIPLAISGHCFF